MKKAAKWIIAVVTVGVTFMLGMMTNEYSIYRHCMNDPGYIKIDGEEFACVNKQQFLIQFMPRSQIQGSST